jgi:hypothetical protein
MELLVYRMLNDGKFIRKKFFFECFRLFLGHQFEKPEYIMNNLQQGIW